MARLPLLRSISGQEMLSCARQSVSRKLLIHITTSIKRVGRVHENTMLLCSQNGDLNPSVTPGVPWRCGADESKLEIWLFVLDSTKHFCHKGVPVRSFASRGTCSSPVGEDRCLVSRCTQTRHPDTDRLASLASLQVSGVGTRGVSSEGSAEQLPNAYFLLPQVQSIQLSQTQVILTELL